MKSKMKDELWNGTNVKLMVDMGRLIIWDYIDKGWWICEYCYD